MPSCASPYAQAFELYFRHLKPDGLPSNAYFQQFLDLKPVVEAAARSLGAKTKTIINDADKKNDIYTATWVLVYRHRAAPRGTDDDETMLRWNRSNIAVRPWTG